MTETYQSVGSAAPTFYAILGPLILLFVTVMYLRRGKMKVQINPKRYVLIACMGVLCILCGLFDLPIALFWLGFVITMISSTALAAKDPVPKQHSTTSSLVTYCFLGLVWLFVAWIQADRRITLTADTITETFARHRFKSTSGSRSDLHVLGNVNPPDAWWLDNAPFTEWQIWSGPSQADSIYIIGQTWYWGPHGLITSDQLAHRIADWAKVQPKVVTKHY